MEIMNDGFKEGDYDYVIEDEMFDEFYVDEKDVFDCFCRCIEELIDWCRKGIEKYKEFKDFKNYEKICWEKFQCLQELVQDVMEWLNYEKMMCCFFYCIGGDKGEIKYNNMFGFVKCWCGWWMFVFCGQENEVGIVGVEIIKDNYWEFLGFIFEQVCQEDICIEEGCVWFVLLDVFNEYI